MADHVLRLSDFPVEILCLIFSKTDSADRVNLAQVCQAFDFVLRRRELNLSVDFQRAYDLDPMKMYLYLTDRTRCNFIISVNLNSCYWIPSEKMKKLLLKLKNLETMLVADTKLTTSALEALVLALPKVKNIAFSWNERVFFGLRTANLRSIYIYITPLTHDPLYDIKNFLRTCTGIEKISIISSSLSVPYLSHPLVFAHELREDAFLPKLRFLLANHFSPAGIRPPLPHSVNHVAHALIMSSIVAKSDWKSFWIPINLHEDMLGNPGVICLRRNLENCDLENPIMDRVHMARSLEEVSLLEDPMYSPLSKLRSLAVHCDTWNIDVIPSLFREGCQLEELVLYGDYDKKVLPLCREMPNCLSSQRLRKLCIPVCAIWRKKTAQPTSNENCFQGLGKRPRISHITVTDSSVCTPFLNLVRSCPNMEVFVMDNKNSGCLTSTLPDDFEWDPEQLSHIANWGKLRKLTLGGIPISSFSFLHKIGESCPYVTSLAFNFLHLTASAFDMSGLVKALPLFTILEDLAVWQPRGISVLHCLRQETLRRVTLLCNNISRWECEEFLANCTKVVFLYIVSDLSKIETKVIKISLLKRFAHRHALIFDIVQYRPSKSKNLEYRVYEAANVPGIHAYEMLTTDIKIGGPLPGDNYIPCE